MNSGGYIARCGAVAPKAQVAKVNAAGLPVALHSIGDAAVCAKMDAFEAAQAEKPSLPCPTASSTSSWWPPRT